MDVRAEMLVFPGFRGPDRSFCPRTSAGISAWTSAGYPAPKLTLWAAFSFLSLSPPPFSRWRLSIRTATESRDTRPRRGKGPIGKIPGWSKNRTGENRTGEPRPSTRGPLRGRLRGESLKAENREIRPRGCSRGQTRGATRGPTRGSRFAFACSVRLQLESPRTNRENPGKKSGKVPKKDKRRTKKGQVQIGKPPGLKPPPRLA